MDEADDQWAVSIYDKQIYTSASTDSKLLSYIKSCKLQYFGHAIRQLPTAMKTAWQGFWKGLVHVIDQEIFWFENIIA